jgi:alkylation response protein AidB-like acyl-CoA dehydrogenase
LSDVDLNLNESQLILRQAAREFLAAECPPSMVKAMETDPKGYPDELWRRIVQMGWPGIVVPEEFGGHAGGFLDLVVLLQEMGRAALPGPFFPTAVLGGLAIMEGGSAEQQRALLPRICSGDLLLSLALSEPGADFGLERVATTALARNGRHSISGTKVFVPDAHVAELLLCVANGPDVFLIKTAGPGVTVSALATAMRDKQFEVVFANAPAEAVGTPGTARGWLERALDKAMLAKCAEMTGAGRKALEMSVEYAKVRVQFGKPIGTLQAVQHHCANLATCVETAELMTYRAAWMIEQGLPCRTDVLRAKAWTNEACKRAAALAHQVHGGMGFTREYDLYLYTGRMTAFAQQLGGTRWCHERIADDIGLVDAG